MRKSNGAAEIEGRPGVDGTSGSAEEGGTVEGDGDDGTAGALVVVG